MFSSTCATYGDPLWQLLDESHPQNPINPCGETKLATERALSWYGKADLSDAHVRALNLGAGHGHSVREVIATVERVTDRTVTAIEVDRRAGDPPRLMAAIDLAALHLSWKTRKSPDQIVESAWRWKLGFASRSRYAAH